jgi:hypothetical protein
MTTAKWTINTGEQRDLHYPASRFSEKGVFACVGVEMFLPYRVNQPITDWLPVIEHLFSVF